MLVVVVYDISTKTSDGRKRLRKVGRICANRGVSVQASVFECEMDAQQYEAFQKQLLYHIDQKSDSICFYLLGNHPWSRVVRLGQQRVIWDRETFVI